MSPRHKALEARLVRKLEELSDQIADAEVKALLPPANCSQPDLYVAAKEEHVKALTREKRLTEASLSDLRAKLADHGQMALL